jgi:hypothetical protein
LALRGRAEEVEGESRTEACAQLSDDELGDVDYEGPHAALPHRNRCTILGIMHLTPHSASGDGDGDGRVLPIEDLDPRVWSVMRWRQAHLPLDRVRRRSDWDSLGTMEGRAARKVASRLGLEDRQSFSVVVRHLEEVGRRLMAERPDLVIEDRGGGSRARAVVGLRPAFNRPQFLNFTVGWGTWFRNRQVGIRWRLFRFRTLGYYRGIPTP